jgi:hypothetical protein
MTSSRATLAAAALALAVLVVFGVGLGGGFVYDDHYLIGSNALVRDPARLGDALTTSFFDVSAGDDLAAQANRYYRPVVSLALALQFRAFGDDPFGYHVVSLLLHLA